MKGSLKFPVGNEYVEMNNEKSADVVTYSDTTLAFALDNLAVGKIPHADSVETAEKTEKDLSGNVISETYLTLSNAEMQGIPTAPTYEGTDTTVNQIATCGYFNGLVRKYAGEVDSDMTLAKIIASINQDPNFATNTAIQLDNKQNKTSNLTALNNLGSETGIILATSSETLTTISASSIGKKIMTSSGVEDFRGIIQAGESEFIYDETEKIHWLKIGSPYVSTGNAKFAQAVQLSSANKIQTKETVTFGGGPFTISFWAYISSSSSANTFLFKTNDNIGWQWQGYNAGSAQYTGYIKKGDSNISYNLDMKRPNVLRHFELDYSINGYVSAFVDGALAGAAYPAAGNGNPITRAARTITLGGAICSISNFMILDGVSLHLANFSPPSAPYELTDQTITLWNL